MTNLAVVSSATLALFLLSINNLITVSTAFTPPIMSTDVAANKPQAHLYDPTQRQAHYNGDSNVAQYLVDLHDAKATFDFCGGMMFQLELSDALREHLVAVSSQKLEKQQPVVFDQPRMHMTPNYEKSSHADNTQVFHGREIRQVPHAAGGMGMVLQLSLANEKDPQGWTTAEVERYDGWGHDSGREWRKGNQLQQEGFKSFSEHYGPTAFALHHRFYLHYDRANRIWLSAEDGCEGTPAPAGPQKKISNLFGLL